jgi:ABC-type branched-subunit amino acid transport system substrate-binding protein
MAWKEELMSKKTIITVVVVVVVVVAVVLALALRPTEEEPPIKIGGIFCMTGGLAAMGDLISQSAILAVEEINDAGGVLGRNMTLLIEDSATNDATAFEAYKKLVEVDGVEIIVGPMISGAVMSSGAYAEAQEVCMVSPSASSPLITIQTWKEWAPRTCTKDNFQGQVIADIIIDEGYNATAILVQDTPYGIGIELVVTEILEAANVTIVETIRYDEEALDYLTELNTIKDANPDVIVQVGYHTDSAKIYEGAASLGLNATPWLVAEGVYGLLASEYPAAAAVMAEAPLLGCTLIPEPGEPYYDNFVAAYEARWGESPGVYCDTVYDAVKMIALAIEEAGEYDGAAIKDALYEVGADYVGASGDINWDELGDREHATYGVWDYVETSPGVYEYDILYNVVF